MAGGLIPARSRSSCPDRSIRLLSTRLMEPKKAALKTIVS